MKKILFSLVVLALLIQVPVFAEETEQEAMSAMLMNQPAAASMPGAAKVGILPQTQMVLADDGGVIILMGGRLMKYDADLNLVKEVRMQFPRKNEPALAVEKTDQPSVATELQEKVI